MKSVPAMMLASSLLAFSISSANAQTGNPQPGEKTPSTVDGSTEVEGKKLNPGSVGAMDKAVGDRATSAQDVQRQTEGKPTQAEEADGASPKAEKPGITSYPSGTVGAAPGSDPASKDGKAQ